MRRRTIDAPAKINLGLEILGQRNDGFHEIRTILCTISLRDTLVFEPSPTEDDSATFEPPAMIVDDEQNLVLRALRAMRATGVAVPSQHVTIHKRIPAAAGLGGASSDAASTLLAFREKIVSAGADIQRLASQLGSDVPFFLNGPIALAGGRGEQLIQLPNPTRSAWVVLVTPPTKIPDKTRSMYAAVDSQWWTDGARIQATAAGLPALPAIAPPNVFERALFRLHPELADLPSQLHGAGVPFAALTGAGPTFYGLVHDELEAESASTRLKRAGHNPIVARLGWSH